MTFYLKGCRIFKLSSKKNVGGEIMTVVKRMTEVIKHANPEVISEKKNRERIEGEQAALKVEETASLVPRM